MLSYRTIVAAVDFSATSREALQLAGEIVRDAPPCHLHVLHVLAEHVCDAWAVKAPALDPSDLHRDWVERAQRQLERLAGTLRIAPSQLTCTAMVGSPAFEITRYAADHGADLIIIGSHGYGPVKRLMLGSVAEYVRRHAHCAVLVVPHQALSEQPAETESSAAAAS